MAVESTAGFNSHFRRLAPPGHFRAGLSPGITQRNPHQKS
jgi:hypothetical protein